MRNVIVGCVTLVFLSCTQQALSAQNATQRASIRAAVAAGTDSAFASVSRLDIDGFLKALADQPVADQGHLRSVNEIGNTYRAVYAGLTTLEFNRRRSDIQVLDNDAALVVTEGSFRGVRKDGAVDSGDAAWTFLWTRKEGVWRILHFHQSVARAPLQR